MSAKVIQFREKVIPFRIDVNPNPYRTMQFLPPDNQGMENRTVERTLAELSRERNLDVFKPDGSLSHNGLARVLSQRSGKKIHQSFITRLINGDLIGKDASLKPMADAFGMSAVELLARLRPETAAAPTPSLPPEAAELWALWSQLPRHARNYFSEQIKNVVATTKQFPNLTAAINGEAQTAANATRAERQRKRKHTPAA